MTAICLFMDRSTFLSFAIHSYIYYDKSRRNDYEVYTDWFIKGF